MKKLSYILLVLLVSSCTSNFETINTNPNDPTQVENEFLLRQVIYNTGEEMSYEGFVAGNLLAQHFTMVDFNLFDRHALTDPQLGGNPWPVLYKNLRDTEIIISQARENEDQLAYLGPAMILKAHLMMNLTDIYGNVPIFEAVQGVQGITKPSYDDQEDIYLSAGGIQETLIEGIEACGVTNTATITGDIMFDGDLTLWEKFGNSLLLKMYVRISEATDVSNALGALFATDNFLENNNQNAVFDFTDLPPNSFRMQQLRDGDFNLFVMSETMDEITSELNDPRVSVLFRPAENGTASEPYNGTLNGPDASSSSITVSDFSLPGTIFRDHTGDLDANFMTAWETEFLLAEAAEKGLINSDAKAHYDNGVGLAFEYWGVEMPNDYLTSAAAYGANGADKLNQIITQKWIANSINGYESWIEYRRTGFPALKSISASLNNDLIPVKMPYPSEEEALNADNYFEATSQNGNSVNVNVWWDVD